MVIAVVVMLKFYENAWIWEEFVSLNLEKEMEKRFL
jgi:hypothetical protein